MESGKVARPRRWRFCEHTIEHCFTLVSLRALNIIGKDFSAFSSQLFVREMCHSSMFITHPLTQLMRSRAPGTRVGLLRVQAKVSRVTQHFPAPHGEGNVWETQVSGNSRRILGLGRCRKA